MGSKSLGESPGEQIGILKLNYKKEKMGEEAIDAEGVGDVETWREKRIRERQRINKEKEE